MHLSIVSVFSFTLCIVSCSAKVTLDVSSSVCLGSVAKVTCITNGTNILGWRYNLTERYYNNFSQLSHTVVKVGPITTQLTCVRGSEFISVATINVTNNLKGIVLECADNDFSHTKANKKNYTLSVEEYANISSLDVNPMSRDQIGLSWPKPPCVASYRLTVEGQHHNLQTNSMIYKSNTSKTLQLSVTGLDFFGNDINTVYKVYYFGRYNFTVIIEVLVNITGDNMTFADVLVTIKPADIDQPPRLLCWVTLTNKADPSKIYESNCPQQSLMVKFDVTPGTNYTFQVNVTNIVGTTRVKGNLTIPMKPVQIIISGTVTSTITIIEHTPVPTISAGNDTPYIIGISTIASVLVVVILISTIIIITLSLIICRKKKKANEQEHKDCKSQVELKNFKKKPGKI